MTKDQLMQTCDKIGLPFAPISKPHELFDDPHLNQSGNMLEITLSNGNQSRIPGLPIEIGGRRTAIWRDLPGVGEHGLQILKEVGYTNAEIENLHTSGALLRPQKSRAD